MFDRRAAKKLPEARRQVHVRQALVACSSTGNATRDDAPNHIRIQKHVPREVAEAWAWMCPAGVYEIPEDAARRRARSTSWSTTLELRAVRGDHGQGRAPDPARGRRRAAVHAGLGAQSFTRASAWGTVGPDAVRPNRGDRGAGGAGAVPRARHLPRRERQDRDRQPHDQSGRHRRGGSAPRRWNRPVVTRRDKGALCRAEQSGLHLGL